MQYQHLQHFSARAPAPVQDSFSFHKQLQSPLYVKLPSPVDPPEYVWSRPLPTPPATKSVCWGENQVREIEHREDYLQMSSGYGVEAEPEIDEGQQAYYRDHSMELGPCYGDDHDQGHSRRRHRHHRNHRRHGHQGRILITTAVTTGDEHEDQQMTLTPSSSEDENDLDMDLSSDESGSEDMSVRRVHQDIVHSCLGWSAVASIPECDNETSDISESDVSVDEHDHEEEGDIVTDGESTGRFVTNHQASLSRPSGQGFGSVMEHDPLPPQRRSPPPPRPPRRDFFSGGIFSRTDLSKYYSFETTAASSAKDQDPTHIASSSGEASKGIAPELVTSSFSHDLSSPVQTRHPYCPQLDRDEIRAQTAERRARSGGLGRQGGQDDDQYGSRRGSHLPWSPSSAYEFQYGSLMGSSLAIQLQSHYDHDEVPLSNMHRHQRHPQTHRLQFEYRYEYRPQPQFQYRYQSQPENRHDSGESSPLSMSSPSPVQSPILPPGSSGIVGDNSGDVVGTSFESKSDGTPSPPTSIRLTERFPSRATECMGESTFA
ncbi:hypothetical protein BGW38_002900 [Lunasporangiospora selenospora]|uniref:Uncharacterized protein n=1 Tax=Lunasporangiospora selenospora TaxID=979761 RepID=A0A9P6FRE9_9FUNG|nr:hypothetical protein BGW38_002900 [Lunasporangiospora selenospora]